MEEEAKLKLVYTAGKTIVKKQVGSEVMEFIKLSDTTESIECLSIPPTRTHVAVC
jgi:hypothetical protein